MNKKECKLWRKRLKDAMDDEEKGIHTYLKYAVEAPTAGTRALFKQAARDEQRHYNEIRMVFYDQLPRMCKR